ncbi:2-thiouracil desulfurase family protein [Bacillus cereus]
MIVISACLGGIACRYDGNDNLVSKIEELLQKEDTVLICPEVLGGLPTPRPSAEIIGGNGDDVLDGKAKVMTKDGEDVTEAFVNGAYKALEQIKNLHPEYIILKERSPSCGSSTIYTGEFNGNKQTGYGVTTALFKRHGFKVISEEEFESKKRNCPCSSIPFLSVLFHA